MKRWLVASWLLVCGTSLAAPPTEPPAGEAPGAGIEDPRRLEALADEALAAGRAEEAKALYEAMLKRQEVTIYLNYRDDLRDALVLERLGRLDEAAAAYRTSFEQDVLRAVQVLRILSVHPQRDALVAEAYDHVRDVVARAKAGEQAAIYRTSKGEPRYLELLTVPQVVAAAAKGEELAYCYVETLDLSDVPADALPRRFGFNRCIFGNIRISGQKMGKFSLFGLVLGDADFGKTWEGERHKSKTLPESDFEDLYLRGSIFLGKANFSDVTVTDGRAYFPMAVFEQDADFKGAEFFGDTDFRFASFGAGANFKDLRMHAPVYFGGTRYRSDTVFTRVFSARDVYFNSAVFERAVSFDDCVFERSATFEDGRFDGPVNFGTTRVRENLNLSRTVFAGTVNVKEIDVGELDVLGAHFRGDAWFMDAAIRGRTRFSLDEVTRHALREHLDQLLPLYRRYQGDEDADQPLTTTSSYGVDDLDDLNSKIDTNISFANTMFGGYTVFEGVTFGTEGEPSAASFFNSQFLGETHFERTEWHAQADFTTIFGQEVAFNQALFHRSLILDDAAISGRVTLVDAEFSPDADLSLYGAELASFQIDAEQVSSHPGSAHPHRLFYEHCALGDVDRDDVRLVRILAQHPELDDAGLRRECFACVVDEFVALKDSYGDRAMTTAEDDAYWWARHLQALEKMAFGGPVAKVYTGVVELLLFELCFGWGVRLGNLGIAVVLVSLLFAILYRVFCPDTILSYDGEDIPIRDVPFLGLCNISLQSLISVNTGWDFGADDHTFRWLNTFETLLGFIILTFFVGAYTRMILA